MKCKHCNHRYTAAISQTGPGGSSAPGGFFILTIALSIATIIGFGLLQGWVPWLLLGLTCFAIFATLNAWFDCRGPAGGSATGGEGCPECGGTNRVYPWSL